MLQKRHKFTLTLLGIILALLVLEVGLRLAGSIYRQRYVAMLQDRSDSIRILCLGESSTAGLWLDPKDSYPKQLEAMLNERYRTDRIKAIVPINIGQNSSQIVNRAPDYLQAYRPKLVIAMLGANNEWSFAENNFVRFLKGSDAQVWKLRMAALWDQIRILKVIRFIFLKYSVGQSGRTGPQGWQAPEYTSYPPEEWKWQFATHNSQAFTDGWEYDLTKVIRRSKKSGANFILMNYHINPVFLHASAIQEFADKENVTFVNNDAPWQQQVTSKKLTKDYVLQDGWHPSRKGYEFIARNVFRTIVKEDLLGLNPH
jgi:lysophospholipase L1-like esterase